MDGWLLWVTFVKVRLARARLTGTLVAGSACADEMSFDTRIGNAIVGMHNLRGWGDRSAAEPQVLTIGVQWLFVCLDRNTAASAILTEPPGIGVPRVGATAGMRPAADLPARV